MQIIKLTIICNKCKESVIIVTNVYVDCAFQTITISILFEIRPWLTFAVKYSSERHLKKMYFNAIIYVYSN